VTLRARVPNPAGLLLPGMVVRAVIDQARDPAALLVPQAGVQRGSGGEATALVVEADGRVAARSLRVAEALAGRWRVLAGLAAGDRVIVEGSAKVRPGQIVHAVPAGTATAQAAPAAAAR
jgi:membrane fusion protein (multidrug efflux system)